MVEILLAVYNGERFLKEQIESILNQSYLDWKLTIYDDGSSDGTESIVYFYLERFKDRIRYIKSDENLGSAKEAFSKLLSFSKESYVAFCDHDDVWTRDKLKVSVKEMKRIEGENNKVPVLIHTDLVVVDDRLNVVCDSMFKWQNFKFRKKSFRRLLVQNNITGCTVLVNRALLKVCGQIPKEAIMHDWWLGLVAGAFGEISFLKDKTVLYRQHGKNSVGAKNVKSLKYIKKRLFNIEQAKKNNEFSYLQAEIFLNRYENIMSDFNIKILKDYIKTKKYKKLKKVYFLLSGRFLKDGIVRKLGQFLV